MPAYTFVAVGGSTAGVGALAPAQPAGKAAGHLLLLATATRAATETLNAAPAGWTLLAESSSTANDSLALYGRIATNDANDDVSHDFWSGSTSAVAQIAAFSGDVHTDLATIVAHSNFAGSAGNVANIPNPALTVTTANTLIIGIGKKSKTVTSDGATVTSPAGLDHRIGLRWSNGTVTGLVWDYTQQTVPTNISASIWDQSIEESAPYASLIVALLTALPPVGATPSPGVSAIALSGLAPTLQGARAISPGVATLAMQGLAPVTTLGQELPSTAVLRLAGLAPQVIQQTGPHAGIGTAILVFEGLAPTLILTRTISPALPTAAGDAVALAPTVLTQWTVKPAPAMVTLGTGIANLIKDGSTRISPDRALLNLAGTLAEVVVPFNGILAPSRTTLDYIGRAPSLVQTWVVIPARDADTDILALHGLAPTLRGRFAWHASVSPTSAAWRTA